MSAPDDSADNVVPLQPRGSSDASAAPPSPPGGKGPPRKRAERKRDLPANFFDNLQTLKKHFALIHGTDTAWDGVNRMVMKIAHMRLTFGNDAVKAWLNAPDRRMVLKDAVVFDPTETVDERTHVNLFDGFEVEPTPGECTKTLALLEHLCGGAGDVYQWILRWTALPLQRQGAKMHTAIVMHGAEGTGKNLFWGAIQAIYGRYGTIIGQAQLESEFNAWLSAKLFVIGNEVLGRKEKWELKGALKHLVTEDFIYINEKNMPERVERNHANLVFLSNELQPLVLGRGDRRYLVVECWKTHPEGEAFYAGVRAELAAGGVEALYHHLRTLDLGDFAPHTKPIETEAKRDLVELGKDEPERFLEQWRAGMLPLPYGAGTAQDLYTAFRRWCQRQGERHVPSLTRFGRAAKAMLRAKVGRMQVRWGTTNDTNAKTYYWDEGAVPDSCEDVDEWVKQQCQRLADAVFDANDPMH